MTRGGLFDRRPSSVWTLSLLLIGAAARTTGAAVARTGPDIALLGLGAACITLALGVYAAGRTRAPRSAPLLLALVLAVTTLLVATAPTRADVVLSAFAYPWTALYAAHFLSRRAAYGYVLLASACFAAGIVVSGQPGLLGAWVMVTATVVVVSGVTLALVTALREQSETDPLTGVANRAGFRRLSDRTLTSAARRDRPVALVLCDVDGLKTVNDSRGHAAGDALLSDMVAHWQPVLRERDILARIGGDEFALLLPDTDEAGAVTAVGRLQAATGIAFSAGVAVWRPDERLDTLLSRADAAMYECKARRGRQHIAVPPPRTATATAATTTTSASPAAS